LGIDNLLSDEEQGLGHVDQFTWSGVPPLVSLRWEENRHSFEAAVRWLFENDARYPQKYNLPELLED